jgi:hypothetical protein
MCPIVCFQQVKLCYGRPAVLSEVHRIWPVLRRENRAIRLVPEPAVRGSSRLARLSHLRIFMVRH